MLDEPSVGITGSRWRYFNQFARYATPAQQSFWSSRTAAATLAIADRVYVMEHGRFAREGTPKELAGDDEIRKVYLGV